MKWSIDSVILFDLAFLNNKVSELEAKQNEEHFWDDQKAALKIIDEYNDAKEERDTYVHIEKAHKEIQDLIFACTDEDEDMRALLEDLISDLTAEVKKFRQKLLFKGEFDNLNVTMEIHCGAGGTESQDWADMLSRMYVRWCERHHMKRTNAATHHSQASTSFQFLKAILILRSTKKIYESIHIVPVEQVVKTLIKSKLPSVLLISRPVLLSLAKLNAANSQIKRWQCRCSRADFINSKWRKNRLQSKTLLVNKKT